MLCVNQNWMCTNTHVIFEYYMQISSPQKFVWTQATPLPMIVNGLQLYWHFLKVTKSRYCQWLSMDRSHLSISSNQWQHRSLLHDTMPATQCESSNNFSRENRAFVIFKNIKNLHLEMVLFWLGNCNCPRLLLWAVS